MFEEVEAIKTGILNDWNVGVAPLLLSFYNYFKFMQGIWTENYLHVLIVIGQGQMRE